jgi:hypothetical protein
MQDEEDWALELDPINSQVNQRHSTADAPVRPRSTSPKAHVISSKPKRVAPTLQSDRPGGTEISSLEDEERCHHRRSSRHGPDTICLKRLQKKNLSLEVLHGLPYDGVDRNFDSVEGEGYFFHPSPRQSQLAAKTIQHASKTVDATLSSVASSSKNKWWHS